MTERKRIQTQVREIIYKNLSEEEAIQIFREVEKNKEKYIMTIWKIKAGREKLGKIKNEVKKIVKRPFVLRETKGRFKIFRGNNLIIDIKFEYPYRVAIVLDDCGSSKRNVLRFLKLNIPLTFSIIAGERYSKYLSNMLKSRGYEVILHQGMEPKSYPEDNPGSRAIFLSMSDEEIKKIVNENIDEIKPDGVNNHMGSKFMEDEKKVRVVLRVLRRKGLFFFDSYTTPHTKGYYVAKKIGVPTQKNQFFLDNKNNVEYVLGQFKKVEKRAIRNGWSVAIGHIHNFSTYRALKKIKDEFLKKGIEFVFLKEVIGLKTKRESKEPYVSYRY